MVTTLNFICLVRLKENQLNERRSLQTIWLIRCWYLKYIRNSYHSIPKKPPFLKSNWVQKLKSLAFIHALRLTINSDLLIRLKTNRNNHDLRKVWMQISIYYQIKSSAFSKKKKKEKREKGVSMSLPSCCNIVFKLFLVDTLGTRYWNNLWLYRI